MCSASREHSGHRLWPPSHRRRITVDGTTTFIIVCTVLSYSWNPGMAASSGVGNAQGADPIRCDSPVSRGPGVPMTLKNGLFVNRSPNPNLVV